ncbi:transposase-like protein, IS1381 ISSpn7 [Streptococcus pneumoniae]|nr:transposase-like protein, IS1381 ISSpn7 [Streptococcus pneumoniae]
MRNIGQAGKILADSGYQGLMKIYPQAQTPRKSSKLKPLTVEDKACNHALSKERSKVENIFAKVKTFKKCFQQPIEIIVNASDYE